MLGKKLGGMKKVLPGLGGMKKPVMGGINGTEAGMLRKQMPTRNPNKGVKPGMMKKAVIGKKLGAMKRRAI